MKFSFYHRVGRILCIFLAFVMFFSVSVNAFFAGEAFGAAKEDKSPTLSDVSQLNNDRNDDDDKTGDFDIGKIAFEECVFVDNVKITVSAAKGVFPNGSFLYAEKASKQAEKHIENAVQEIRSDDINVLDSYVYDIKVFDADGVEVQPADNKKVKVTFTLETAVNMNIEPQIYHIEGKGSEMTAEPLDTRKNEEHVFALTNGFSYYQVEFRFNGAEYIMPGASVVYVWQILEAVGLRGEVTDIQVSDAALFDIIKEDAESWRDWFLISHKAFDTNEWMDVTIDGFVYRIDVTDGQTITYPGVQQGTDGVHFADDAPRASIWIDQSKLANLELAQYELLTDMVGFTTKKGNTLTVPDTTIETANTTFAVYDPNMTVTTVDEDNNPVIKTAAPIKKNQYNVFSEEGGLFRYTYEDAAVLSDGTLCNVVVTYNNLSISMQKNASETQFDAAVYIGCGTCLRAGNDSTLSQPRTGIKVDMLVQVINKTTGEPVDGTFYFPVTDIDVMRRTNGNFNQLYGGTTADDPNGKNNGFDEQVQVNGGQIGPLYIPDAAGVDDTMTGSNKGYKCLVEEGTKEGTILFRPNGSDNTNNPFGSYYSGFLALVDNSTGIDLTVWTGGSSTAAVRSYFGHGSTPNKQEVSHYRLISSSTAGGDIWTTLNGNISGKLELDGEGDVRLHPAGPMITDTLIATDGSTTVYTMIPEETFRLKKVWVQDGTGPNGTIQNSDPKTDVTGTLTMLNDATIGDYYTYEFANITADHRIHVAWVTDLYLKKTVANLSTPADRYYKFTMQLSNVEDGDYVIDLSNADATTSVTTHNSTTHTNPTKITVSGGSGTAEIWLKHNQEVKIVDLPKSAKYTFTEEDKYNFNESYVITHNTTDDAAVHGNTTGEQTLTEMQKVNFTNDFFVPVPTGVFADNAPYFISGAFALLATGAIFTELVVKRKRQWNET